MCVTADETLAVNIFNIHLSTGAGARASRPSDLSPVYRGFGRQGTDKGTTTPRVGAGLVSSGRLQVEK